MKKYNLHGRVSTDLIGRASLKVDLKTEQLWI